MKRWHLVLLPLLLACNKDKEVDDTGTPAEGWRPDLVCPGDAGCASTGDGVLKAGAAAVSITPPCFESWEDLNGDAEYKPSEESFYDCGCDQLCAGDPGYPGPDEGEGDGVFQAVWMAGFQNSRPAMEVHDDLWARAVALRQGDTTVAVVALDLVGFFNGHILQIREDAAAAGVDVDHIIVTSTHVHEGPDTMGLWGRDTFESGVNDEYMAYVRAQTVEAVRQAVAGLEPVTLSANAIDTAAPFGDKGTRNTIRDSRDPVIVDELLYVAQLKGSSGATVATLLNWGNHPEALSDENNALTSDFVHYIRDAVENGVHYDSYDVDGVGGVAVFLNGTVGGLMTPLGVHVTDGEGNEWSESNWDKAGAIGKVIGELALDALSDAQPVSNPALAVRMAQVYLPIDNFGFQTMFQAGVLVRETYHWDPDQNISEDNLPEILTEMDVLDLGPIRMLTVPGELFPEVAIGGYDGSRVNTTEDEFIDAGNPNPPDLSQAPAAPYLKDRMGAQYNWILGLGNDELGYIVPAYDFKVDEALPYIEEAEGDHYEETNSLGPQTAPLLEAHAATLLEWSP